MHRLIDRDRRGEDQRQRDRHIHPQPPGPQAGPGGFEERLPGKDHRRQRDRRGNPVEQVARRVLGPRPDRDGQQHHVHHRKERDAQPHQQVAPLPVGFGGATAGRGPARAPPSPSAASTAISCGGGDVGRGLDADPLQRQVHPGRPHARHRLTARASTVEMQARAMRRRQRQHDPPVALGPQAPRSVRRRAPPRRPGRPRCGCACPKSSARAIRQPFTNSSERCSNSVPSAARGGDLDHPFARRQRHIGGIDRRPSCAKTGQMSSVASVVRPTSTSRSVTGDRLAVARR